MVKRRVITDSSALKELWELAVQKMLSNNSSWILGSRNCMPGHSFVRSIKAPHPFPHNLPLETGKRFVVRSTEGE